MATKQVPSRTPERQEFYDRIAPRNLAPLWEKLHHTRHRRAARPLRAGALAL